MVSHTTFKIIIIYFMIIQKSFQESDDVSLTNRCFYKQFVTLCYYFLGVTEGLTRLKNLFFACFASKLDLVFILVKVHGPLASST